jgi:hypothetical protein
MKKLQACLVCAAVLLLHAAIAVAGSVYSVSEPTAGYGFLSQENATVAAEFGSQGCGPTAAANSLLYLQNLYPNVYGDKLVANGDTDTLANLAVTLGGTSYLNWQNDKVTYSDFTWGTYDYVEAFAPNLTSYIAEADSKSSSTTKRPIPTNWISVNANTSGTPSNNPTYPTWQFIYNQLQANKAVLIKWSGNGQGHFMSVTGIYFSDVRGDGFIHNTDGDATITYIDPKDGKSHTAPIWQRGKDGNPPDGELIIDYGETSSGYPAGWWYTGTASIGLAMSLSAATTYSISGTVKSGGSPLAGVSVTLAEAGAPSSTVKTASNGTYSFSGLPKGSYTVTPSLAGYTFNPPQATVPITNQNVTENFTATAFYSISGTVVTSKDAPLAGVTLTLSGAAKGSFKTGSDGSFSFPGLQKGSYTVTPSMTGYTFSPPSSAITLNRNVTGLKFIATAIPTYSISGTVKDSKGALLAGVTVTLGGAATRTTTTGANGTYSFSGLLKGTYTLTPSEAGYTFTKKTVTITNANLTNEVLTGKKN